MSNLSCSMVYLNIDNRMYDTLEPLFLLMESKSSFLYLTSVFKHLEWFGEYSIIVTIDIQQITTMIVIFGYPRRWLLAFLPTHSPRSIAASLKQDLANPLTSQISLSHSFKNTSTHCHQILSPWLKLSNGSQYFNVTKNHSNSCLPLQESIWKLLQMVRPPPHGPILLLQISRRSYFPPLVEHTVVDLPHAFGKLLQRELNVLQTNCGLIIFVNQMAMHSCQPLIMVSAPFIGKICSKNIAITT